MSIIMKYAQNEVKYISSYIIEFQTMTAFTTKSKSITISITEDNLMKIHMFKTNHYIYITTFSNFNENKCIDFSYTSYKNIQRTRNRFSYERRENVL